MLSSQFMQDRIQRQQCKKRLPRLRVFTACLQPAGLQLAFRACIPGLEQGQVGPLQGPKAAQQPRIDSEPVSAKRDHRLQPRVCS